MSKDRTDEAGDGFGIMRIGAAVMVIFAHSFPLARGAEDPTWQRGSVIISFGSAAVSIFFVISGYLVLSSWIRDPNPLRFAVRRVARMIHRHLDNVLTYFDHRITNAVSEGLNSKIQTIKKTATGIGIGTI